jgi:hypothetical protein
MFNAPPKWQVTSKYPHKPFTFHPHSFPPKLTTGLKINQTSSIFIRLRRIMFRCAGQWKGVVCLRRNNYGRCVVAVFQARRRRWCVACRKPAACMFTEGIWLFVRCLHCRRLMMCKYNYFDYMLI